jgi:hypothetical protein
MPYLSQVQHVLPELTLDGEELFVERDVRDGTSESLSESMNDESVDVEDAGDTDCRAKRLVSASMVAWSYCVLMTWRVWCGRSGLGAMIFDGDRERPFGIDATEDVLIRLLWSRLDDRREDFSWRVDVEEDEFLVFPGISRMLSFRPVVGSVVWSRAGSCDTWYPSMM